MKYKKGQVVTINQEDSDDMWLDLNAGEYEIKECSETDIEIMYFIEKIDNREEGMYIEECQLDVFIKNQNLKS